MTVSHICKENTLFVVPSINAYRNLYLLPWLYIIDNFIFTKQMKLNLRFWEWQMLSLRYQSTTTAFEGDTSLACICRVLSRKIKELVSAKIWGCKISSYLRCSGTDALSALLLVISFPCLRVKCKMQSKETSTVGIRRIQPLDVFPLTSRAKLSVVLTKSFKWFKIWCFLTV